jgi:hypothetical protein
VQRRFEQAAEHAVCRPGMPGPAAGSARDTWLNLLRAETNAFRTRGSSVRQVKEKVGRGIWGVIERVCEVSADYCEHLADQAEAEQGSRSADIHPPVEGLGQPVEKPEGLSPAEQAATPPVCDAGASSPQSLRVARGELCAKVIGEVEQLYRELKSKSQSTNFEDLRRDYPEFEVLKILSRSLFDDEDRALICHPRQWGVRPPRHATGILKRHFGTDSDNTIRDYRKAYNRERSAGTS